MFNRTPVHEIPDTPRQGRLIAFLITGGEASDSKQLKPLMDIPTDIPPPRTLLADAGYDSDANREELLMKAIRPVIKANPSRKKIPPFDKQTYRNRNRIERMFNRLKQFRRIATRYDKTRSSFQGFVNLAAIPMWINGFVHRT